MAGKKGGGGKAPATAYAGKKAPKVATRMPRKPGDKC